MSVAPVMVSYCATFLPREMLHVYRQVCGVRSFENWIITRRRVHPDEFPFPRLVELRKSSLRAVSRLWYRALGRPVPVSHFETNQMLRFCQERTVSLAHIYLGSEALRVLSFLGNFRGARVVSFHGADLSDELDAKAYACLWPRAELFLCRSRSLREQLVAKGCPSDRIRLNYTGVPLPPSAIVRRAPGSAEPLRILQVCRFIQKKGLDVALHTVRALKAQGTPVVLTLAGEGPEESSLRALTRELDIDKEVTFTGFLDRKNLETAYQQHHIFLHPSRTTREGDREGIPNSILEAMAFGLPVVSTRHSGIPEAITHGESGVLVDQADSETLAAAIRQLIGDPGAYERISRGAAETIANRFSLQANAAALETIYHEALQINASRTR